MNIETTPQASLHAEIKALQRRIRDLETSSATDAAFRYLDAMERIGEVLRQDVELPDLLMQLLDEILDLFQCDRAWLLQPCDPTTPSWSVPMERTREEWPGAFALDVQIPLDQPTADLFREALAASGPLAFDSQSGRAIPPQIATAFHIRSQLLTVLRPRVGHPWMLGIHHCSRGHVFTAEEHRILDGISLRVGETLGTLLLLGDLKASEKRFRGLVENAPDAIVLLDENSRFVDGNAAALSLFDLSMDELLCTKLLSLSTPQQTGGRPSRALLSALMAEAIAGWKPHCQWHVQRPDGRMVETEFRLVLLEDGAEPRFRGSLIDLSTQRSLELQVSHLQKMEVLGELAGGVAHDLNNQLVVILCYAEMLGEAAGASDAAVHMAMRLVKAATDASALTAQLLAFSRRADLHPVPVLLDELVRDSADMLRRILGADIQLQIDLASPGTDPAFVDPQQVEQVLVNLVTNARDASKTGGRVQIHTFVHDIEAAEAGRLGLTPGRFACFSVQDQGTGIAADKLPTVFEPFFTTKDRGKGTGLGLSTARGVVIGSGGAIDLASQPGQGSTFTVYLPVAQQGADTTLRPSMPLPRQGGTERVLIVEEHPTVADIAAQVLRAAGYTVRTAASLQAAEALVASEDGFDLLLTEAILKGGDGVTLAGRLRRRLPGVRVLFATSFSAQTMARFTHTTERIHLLQKPYSPEGLLAHVRTALDAGPKTPK